MPKIFISYRREDSEHIAGRLYDRLEAHFGRKSLFMDIDAIPFGVDFRQYLDRAVGQCDIMLAVIGKGWLEARYDKGPRQGKRRLEDPADFVAIEIGSALARKIPVIPVLVAGATMPAESQLPDSLKALAYRNAAEVRSGQDFHDHVDRLIRSIEHREGQANARRQAGKERQRREREAPERQQRETEEPPGRSAPGPPRDGRRRRLVWLALGVPLLAVTILVALLSSPGDSGTSQKKVGSKDKSSDKDKPPPGEAKVPQPGQPFTNTIGMKFAWIEPGTFWMGSPDGNAPPGVPAEEKREDDETPHEVTLEKGYHLGKHLVTQYQWEEIMGKDANHSNFKGQDEEEKKKLPVDNVTWFDCVDFCIKLSKKEQREPHYRLTDVERNDDGSIKAAKVEMLAGGTGYRLPTEAEWEYACRAGTGTAFWWGNSITTDQANYNGKYTYGKDGKKGGYREKTTPVDSFPANKWGLHDMHGNLYQWCQDWYGKDYYDKSDKKDPKGPDSGDARVLRGGSWSHYPRHCRAALRYRDAPARRYDYCGCRLLLRLD